MDLIFRHTQTTGVYLRFQIWDMINRSNAILVKVKQNWRKNSMQFGTVMRFYTLIPITVICVSLWKNVINQHISFTPKLRKLHKFLCATTFGTKILAPFPFRMGFWLIIRANFYSNINIYYIHYAHALSAHANSNWNWNPFFFKFLCYFVSEFAVPVNQNDWTKCVKCFIFFLTREFDISK